MAENPKPRKVPSPKALKTAAIINAKVDAGETPSRELINEAHREGYGLQGAHSREVAAYANYNLNKNPGFLAALGFNDPALRTYVAEHIITNLEGDNKLFPKDKELYLASLKLAATATFEDKKSITVKLDFTGKTDAELEFFSVHGKWPESIPVIDGEIIS